MTDQLISAIITETASGNTFMFTVVYRSNEEEERLKLWEDPKRIKDNWNGPWSICGDFNNLLDFNERIGRPVHWTNITEFMECVDYCEIMDIKAQGDYFTWNNKQEPSSRVFSRLDRFMINEKWMQLYPDAYGFFLPEDLSKKIIGSCMFQVVSKLRSLKNPLKELNRNRFSDIEKAVGIAKIQLDDIQTQMHRDPCNIRLMEEESDAADTYRSLAKAHFSFLSQKSKVDWGLMHTDPQGIEQAFLTYYTELLGTNGDTLPVHKPTVRTGPVINDQLKAILQKTINPEEIKNSMFLIPASKSPGLDEFTSQFYRDLWEIIGKDVIGAVMDFLNTGLKQVNTTTLNLTPKTKNPISVLGY
ncbi:uncharacterized protein LOC141640292 [Silene latifolia]|uniref:uncharacterized protein LOC141640292 n=1 Tax=Silene latifolia TaxID=37657 RepID=UPI003D7795C0